ncbi:hypothetical protein [Thiocapsa imhoffii]|uniref:hypothetical protein n=1 Tax=Thiocapsa imhoffii TaxID=382777 RepID=UPI001903F067|nr:hypothetical protein [Thiocapsa imhoffii]
MNEPTRGLVPRLRFHEFREAGEWELRQLSDMLSQHYKKSDGAETVFSVSVDKGLVNQIEYLGRKISASSTDHYNQVLPDDVIYKKSPKGEFSFAVLKQRKLAFLVIVSPLYGVFSPETIGL